MARIRSIKPDFWTDEKLTECSLSARLLFIGTWNFADDAGNLDRSAKQIKARIFPIDAIDCEPLIQELIHQELLVEYSVGGKKYLHIHGFAKHQIINRPSRPSCPDFSKDCVSPPVLLSEPSVATHAGGEGRDISQKIESLSETNGVSDPRPSFTADAKTVLEFLNRKTGRRYRPVPVNLKLIEARLKTGVTVQDCKTLIVRKCRDWQGDPKMEPYLRPQTLFCASKFEQYLAQITPSQEEESCAVPNVIGL